MSSLPHVSVVVEPSPPSPSPLRTDVAAFVGRAARGPAGEPRRVESWIEFEQIYGGVEASAQLGWAVRGYFANGGELAHIVRVVGTNAAPASAWLDDSARGITITAASPGAWANDATVTVGYRSNDLTGPGTWSVRLQPVAGRFTSTEPLALPDDDGPAVTASVVIDADEPLSVALSDLAGGRPLRSWTSVLTGGADGEPPTVATYRAALAVLLAESEVALLGLPDIWFDLDSGDATTVIREALAAADRALDRLVLVDLPPAANASGQAAVRAGHDLATGLDAQHLRGGAAYHPWLRVEDPTVRSASGANRAVPPCGHVAGLASRLDRERGPSRSPANADLADVVDVAQSLDTPGELAVTAERVNLIRCSPGRGIQVWGGRTLDPLPGGRFVAHRRLTHRLIRAMRRVAEPLVFEQNTPELRFALKRALTTVLLQAFRTGALKGANPAEAFSVRCDDATTSQADMDAGRVICEVSFVPANPMEVITIRLLLAADGRLEVVEQ
jgi:phage tail sheath protein FI